jgi:hypothetical protein
LKFVVSKLLGEILEEAGLINIGQIQDDIVWKG